jgi:replicative DNA helicase
MSNSISSHARKQSPSKNRHAKVEPDIEVIPDKVKDPLERILAKLERLASKRTGNDWRSKVQKSSKRHEWIATCPKCECMLAVMAYPRERIELYCHGGCTTEDILLALGIGVDVDDLDRATLDELVSLRDFLKTDFQHKWLVEGVLASGQPGVIGGPKKGMKTSVLVDLAVSLASKGKFLGQFSVPHYRKVGFRSGESGGATLKETFLRVMQARGVAVPTEKNRTGYIYIGHRLPRLSTERELHEIVKEIRDHALTVYILDPLYLALLAGSKKIEASNMYQMGPLLSDVALACGEAGATCLMAHHFSMGKNQDFTPPDLGDLAFAGIGEFARQWLLLGRRERFDPESGIHRLWLTVGASAGFSGCWGLDIDEGRMHGDFEGRKWSVTVRSQAEVIDNDKKQKALARGKAKQERLAEAEQEVRTVLAEHSAGLSLHRLQESCDSPKRQVKTALDVLTSEGKVLRCEVELRTGGGGSRKVDGYRLAEIPDPKTD